MAYEPGKHSFEGFTYQLAVLISLLPQMKSTESFGFELDDDVSSYDIGTQQNINVGFVNSENHKVLYQVKKTNVTDDKASRVLYNWLLIDDAKEYHLVVPNGYSVNEDNIKNANAEQIYDSLNSSHPTSLIGQLYTKYKANSLREEFIERVQYIKDNYIFDSDYNPNTIIYENYKIMLHHTTSNDELYNDRLSELEKIIVHRVYSKQYEINRDELMQIAETVCNNLQPDDYKPIYPFEYFSSQFQLTEEKKKTREYAQLLHCNIPEKTIINYLVGNLYYYNMKIHLLSKNIKKVTDWEREAYQNYDEVKVFEEPTSPKELLKMTMNKPISNTYDKNHKEGVYIELTKDGTDIDKQISWEL